MAMSNSEFLKALMAFWPSLTCSTKWLARVRAEAKPEASNSSSSTNKILTAA
jgi:hypothetical protein